MGWSLTGLGSMESGASVFGLDVAGLAGLAELATLGGVDTLLTGLGGPDLEVLVAALLLNLDCSRSSGSRDFFEGGSANVFASIDVNLYITIRKPSILLSIVCERWFHGGSDPASN